MTSKNIDKESLWFSFIEARELKVGDIVSDIITNLRELESICKLEITYVKVNGSAVKLGFHNLDKGNRWDRTTTSSKLYLKFK